MQPAQIKLHPNENFLHHTKIQPPYFTRKIKRALLTWLFLQRLKNQRKQRTRSLYFLNFPYFFLFENCPIKLFFSMLCYSDQCACHSSHQAKQAAKIYICIRTVSSQRLLSTLLIQFKLYSMGCFGRVTRTVHLISVHTSQKH